jgi:hypothetical protein
VPVGGGEIVVERRDPRMPLPRVLEINSVAVDTARGPVLTTTFSWPAGVLDAGRVRELAALWTQTLTDIATSDTVTGHTPSDFPLVQLEQADVTAIEADSPELKDVLPLSPLQTGLYFHATLDPGRDPYVVQQIIELTGPLDGERLRTAAERLLGRHPNLGAAFRTTGDGQVVSVIADRPRVPWRSEDLSDLDLAQPILEEIAAAERSAPFDLARPPAMRFALVKLGSRRHALVHTVHHILADGWSVPLLLRDLLALYEDRPLPEPPPYREFLQMLAAQDSDTAIEAWAGALAGVREPTMLADALADAQPHPLADVQADRLADVQADRPAGPAGVAGRPRRPPAGMGAGERAHGRLGARRHLGDPRGAADRARRRDVRFGRVRPRVLGAGGHRRDGRAADQHRAGEGTLAAGRPAGRRAAPLRAYAA